MMAGSNKFSMMSGSDKFSMMAGFLFRPGAAEHNNQLVRDQQSTEQSALVGIGINNANNQLGVINGRVDMALL